MLPNSAFVALGEGCPGGYQATLLSDLLAACLQQFSGDYMLKLTGHVFTVLMQGCTCRYLATLPANLFSTKRHQALGRVENMVDKFKKYLARAGILNQFKHVSVFRIYLISIYVLAARIFILSIWNPS